jgi:hypothetical protein
MHIKPHDYVRLRGTQSNIERTRSRPAWIVEHMKPLLSPSILDQDFARTVVAHSVCNPHRKKFRIIVHCQYPVQEWLDKTDLVQAWHDSGNCGAPWKG